MLQASVFLCVIAKVQKTHLFFSSTSFDGSSLHIWVGGM